MPSDYAAIDALIVQTLTPRGWEFEDPEDSEGNGRIVGNWSDIRALVEAAQAESKKHTAVMEAALNRIFAEKPEREKPTWDEALAMDIIDDAAECGYDCAAWELATIAENALAGSAPALDAATAELREKCDALAARNAELESAFAKSQSMSCFYCGLNVARDGKSKEEFDAEWQQHIHECDKRPEAKLVSFICWLIAENNIQNPLSDKFPGVYDRAEEQMQRRDLRMKRIGAAEELEDAADEMEARRKQDIDFAPEDLRARAAELRKLAEEEK